MFKKATKAQAKLRAALFGPSGSGKTFSALRIATGIVAKTGGKIAVLDTERGSASKYADRFEFDVAELTTFDVDDYINAINEADGGYSVLVIDSLTHAWDALKDTVQKLADSKFRGNYWAAWSDGTPMQQRFIDTILRFDGHIIGTMRSKTEWSVGDDKKPTRVGLAPMQRDGVEYEFDFLIELTPNHLATVIKDRSGRFQDRMVEKPGEDFGGELVDWLTDGRAPADKNAVMAVGRVIVAASKERGVEPGAFLSEITDGRFSSLKDVRWADELTAIEDAFNKAAQAAIEEKVSA